MEKYSYVASGMLAVFILLIVFSQIVFAETSGILIQEVGFSEAHDFVELKVINPGNYDGYTVHEGGVHIATIPEFGELESNDILLVHQEKESEKHNHLDSAYHMFDMGGLTGTDNVLQLKDSSGSLVDALIWSNDDGKFTGNRTQAHEVVSVGKWISPEAFSSVYDAAAWVSSKSVATGKSLNRIEENAGISSEGYEMLLSTPGYELAENNVPIAAFELLSEYTVGDTVTLDASASLDPDGDELLYLWTINGEEIESEAVLPFVFEESGDVEIALTVEDSYGAQHAKSALVTVLEKAYSHDVRISELFPNPKGDDSLGEFIEIENNGLATVDLEGYSLSDGSRTYIFPTQIMLPGEYLHVIRTETSIVLNNTHESISLHDPNNKVIDTVEYLDGKEDMSFSYINGRFEWTNVVSPGKENSSNVSHVDTPETLDEASMSKKESIDIISKPSNVDKKSDQGKNHHISISELLPNPKGKDQDGEWIELYNYGEDVAYLNGWFLDDEEGGSKPYALEELVLQPKEYAVINRSTSGIQLNNSEDSVRLIGPDGSEVDGVRYLNVPGEDFSFARNAEMLWEWTLNPTKGLQNIIVLDKDTTQSSRAKKSAKKKIASKSLAKKKKNTKETAVSGTIKDSLLFDKGTFVSVQGIITVAPGMLSKRMFFVADTSGASQVYKSAGDIPEVSIGDAVSIIGKISETKGEKRILLQEVSDVKVIESNVLVDSSLLQTGAVSNDHFNQIVHVEAVVEKVEGNTVFVDDESGILRVYFPRGSKVSGKDVKIGSKYVFKGIIRTKDEHIVLSPRLAADVSPVLSSEALEAGDSTSPSVQSLGSDSSSKNGSQLWIIVSVCVAAGLGYVLYRRYST